MDIDFETYFSYLRDNNKKTEIINNTSNCINCASEALHTDLPNGVVVCTECGSINQNSIIDESAEWNFNSEDAAQGKDPSRCGCPTNPFFEKSSMSTFIGGKGKTNWLMRRIHQQQSMDYVERARWHIFEGINRVAEANSLPAIVTNQAKIYYKALSEKKLSRGGVRQGLIACCFLYACKSCNVPRSVKEIAQICNIETAKINNATKIFEEIMNIQESISENESANTKSNDLITRFVSHLNLNKQEKQKLMKRIDILNKNIETTGILVGKTPSAITSAMIYVILDKDGNSINKKNLASQHNISVVTLNKIVKLIEQHSQLLNIENV
jgi:transcription initiation factor TFIIIB Brf1 subunit/transcription initiation factor TFIIB